MVGQQPRSGGAKIQQVADELRDDAASPRLAVATPRPTTESKRRARAGLLAQCLVYPFSGVAAHARHPVRVAVKSNGYAGVPQKMLNQRRMNALTASA
jgi:hypothetical protein